MKGSLMEYCLVEFENTWISSQIVISEYQRVKVWVKNHFSNEMYSKVEKMFCFTQLLVLWHNFQNIINVGIKK